MFCGLTNERERAGDRLTKKRERIISGLTQVNLYQMLKLQGGHGTLNFTFRVLTIGSTLLDWFKFIGLVLSISLLE